MTSEDSVLHGAIGDVPLIWYASYGSNMDADRFACYIVGGIPNGGSRDYTGCTDKSLPISDRAITLPQQLYFAGESKVWTGGLAFITHNAGEDTTLGRAYLITAEQFEQVAAQESWRDEALKLDISLLRSMGHLTMGDGSGNYDEMIYCGDLEGYPIVSFTSPTERKPYTKPARAYLRMISDGLRKAHGLSSSEVHGYLISKPGIAGNYTSEELTAVLD